MAVVAWLVASLGEAFVELEGRHLQPGKVGEGAVAGAEVVDGGWKPASMRLARVALYLVGILHQHPFGDLQLQLPGGEPVARDAVEDLRAELRDRLELQGREVDGGEHQIRGRHLPVGKLGTAELQHQLAELADEPQLLRQQG